MDASQSNRDSDLNSENDDDSNTEAHDNDYAAGKSYETLLADAAKAGEFCAVTFGWMINERRSSMRKIALVGRFKDAAQQIKRFELHLQTQEHMGVAVLLPVHSWISVASFLSKYFWNKFTKC